VGTVLIAAVDAGAEDAVAALPDPGGGNVRPGWVGQLQHTATAPAGGVGRHRRARQLVWRDRREGDLEHDRMLDGE
jgi:hypothetical protein